MMCCNQRIKPSKRVIIRFALSVFLIIVILVSIIYIGWNVLFPPFTVTDAESYLDRHKNELNTLAEFLLNTESDSYTIHSAYGTAIGDMKRIEITDETVLSCLRELYSDKCIRIGKDTAKNCIDVEICTRGDITYGLLYAIDPSRMPEAWFMTDIISLSDDQWFYYEADYNQWRVEKSENSQ